MTGTQVLGSFKQLARRGAGAPVMMLVMLAMMMLPLPPFLLDILFSFNIALSLVILLAARHPHELTAIASFSPGEYFDDTNLVKKAAAKIAIPFYITTDPDEAGNVAEVLRNAHGGNIVDYRPAFGVHGASTLVQARDPRGYQANLASFTAFLQRVAHARH